MEQLPWEKVILLRPLRMLILLKNADGTVKYGRSFGTLPTMLRQRLITYATTTVTNDVALNKYIADNGITTNKDGTPLNDIAGKGEYKAER